MKNEERREIGNREKGKRLKVITKGREGLQRKVGKRQKGMRRRNKEEKNE